MKRTIKQLSAALALAVGVAVPAHAQLGQVQYQTFFSFTNLAGSFATSASQTYTGPDGTATLTFTGLSKNLNAFPITNAQFGTIQSAATGNGADIGGNIFLQIVQSIPSAGSATSTGTILGHITTDAAGISHVAWTSPYVIGGVNYTISGTDIVPPNQSATISGTIASDIVATPEPASMTLLATGLVGIFGAARRRKTIAA